MPTLAVARDAQGQLFAAAIAAVRFARLAFAVSERAQRTGDARIDALRLQAADSAAAAVDAAAMHLERAFAASTVELAAVEVGGLCLESGSVSLALLPGAVLLAVAGGVLSSTAAVRASNVCSNARSAVRVALVAHAVCVPGGVLPDVSGAELRTLLRLIVTLLPPLFARVASLTARYAGVAEHDASTATRALEDDASLAGTAWNSSGAACPTLAATDVSLLGLSPSVFEFGPDASLSTPARAASSPFAPTGDFASARFVSQAKYPSALAPEAEAAVNLRSTLATALAGVVRALAGAKTSGADAAFWSPWSPAPAEDGSRTTRVGLTPPLSKLVRSDDTTPWDGWLRIPAFNGVIAFASASDPGTPIFSTLLAAPESTSNSPVARGGATLEALLGSGWEESTATAATPTAAMVIPTPRAMLLRAWILSKRPIPRVAARKRQFPEIEALLFIALVRHATRSSTHAAALEVSSVLASLEAGAPAGSVDEKTADSRFAGIAASPELVTLWTHVLDFRRWLRDRCEAFAEADAELTAVAASALASSADDESASAAAGVALTALVPGSIATELALRIRVASSASIALADAFVADVQARAAFCAAQGGPMSGVPISPITAEAVDILTKHSISMHAKLYPVVSIPEAVTSAGVAGSGGASIGGAAAAGPGVSESPNSTTRSTISLDTRGRILGQAAARTMFPAAFGGPAAPSDDAPTPAVASILTYVRDGWAAPPALINLLRSSRSAAAAARAAGFGAADATLSVLESCRSPAVARELTSAAIAGLFADAAEGSTNFADTTLLSPTPRGGLEGACASTIAPLLNTSGALAARLVGIALRGIAALRVRGADAALALPALVAILSSDDGGNAEAIFDVGSLVRELTLTLRTPDVAGARDTSSALALSGRLASGASWAPLSPRTVLIALESGAAASVDVLIHMVAGSVAARAPGAVAAALREVLGRDDDAVDTAISALAAAIDSNPTACADPTDDGSGRSTTAVASELERGGSGALYVPSNPVDDDGTPSAQPLCVDADVDSRECDPTLDADDDASLVDPQSPSTGTVLSTAMAVDVDDTAANRRAHALTIAATVLCDITPDLQCAGATVALYTAWLSRSDVRGVVNAVESRTRAAEAAARAGCSLKASAWGADGAAALGGDGVWCGGDAASGLAPLLVSAAAAHDVQIASEDGDARGVDVSISSAFGAVESAPEKRSRTDSLSPASDSAGDLEAHEQYPTPPPLAPSRAPVGALLPPTPSLTPPPPPPFGRPVVAAAAHELAEALALASAGAPAAATALYPHTPALAPTLVALLGSPVRAIAPVINAALERVYGMLSLTQTSPDAVGRLYAALADRLHAAATAAAARSSAADAHANRIALASALRAVSCALPLRGSSSDSRFAGSPASSRARVVRALLRVALARGAWLSIGARGLAVSLLARALPFVAPSSAGAGVAESLLALVSAAGVGAGVAISVRTRARFTARSLAGDRAGPGAGDALLALAVTTAATLRTIQSCAGAEWGASAAAVLLRAVEAGVVAAREAAASEGTVKKAGAIAQAVAGAAAALIVLGGAPDFEAAHPPLGGDVRVLARAGGGAGGGIRSGTLLSPTSHAAGATRSVVAISVAHGLPVDDGSVRRSSSSLRRFDIAAALMRASVTVASATVVGAAASDNAPGDASRANPAPTAYFLQVGRGSFVRSLLELCALPPLSLSLAPPPASSSPLKSFSPAMGFVAPLDALLCEVRARALCALSVLAAAPREAFPGTFNTASRNPLIDAIVLGGGLGVLSAAATARGAASGYPTPAPLFSRASAAASFLLDVSVAPRALGARWFPGTAVASGRAGGARARDSLLHSVGSVSSFATTTSALDAGQRMLSMNYARASLAWTEPPGGAHYPGATPPPLTRSTPSAAWHTGSHLIASVGTAGGGATADRRTNSPPAPPGTDAKFWASALEVASIVGMSPYWCLKAIIAAGGNHDNAVNHLLDHAEPAGFAAAEETKARAASTGASPQRPANVVGARGEFTSLIASRAAAAARLDVDVFDLDAGVGAAEQQQQLSKSIDVSMDDAGEDAGGLDEGSAGLRDARSVAGGTALAHFDECIMEGIAFNEPLIDDKPPRLPFGYKPVSKADLLALGAGIGSGATSSATLITRAAAKNGASSRQARTGAGALATTDSADCAAWDALGDEMDDIESSGMGEISRADEFALAHCGLARADEFEEMGGAKTGDATASTARGAHASSVFAAWRARSAREYLSAACTAGGSAVAADASLARFLSFARSSRPLRALDVPVFWGGGGSAGGSSSGPAPLGSSAAPWGLVVASPRAPVSAIPRGSLVWVEARRADASALSALRVARAGGGGADGHERLVALAAAAVERARGEATPLACDGGSAAGLGLLATVERHAIITVVVPGSSVRGGASPLRPARSDVVRAAAAGGFAFAGTVGSNGDSTRRVRVTVVRVAAPTSAAGGGALLLTVPSEWVHIATSLHGGVGLLEPVPRPSNATKGALSTPASALLAARATSLSTGAGLVARATLASLLAAWPRHLPLTLSALAPSHAPTPAALSALPQAARGALTTNTLAPAAATRAGRSTLLLFLKLVVARDDALASASGAVIAGAGTRSSARPVGIVSGGHDSFGAIGAYAALGDGGAALAVPLMNAVSALATAEADGTALGVGSAGGGLGSDGSSGGGAVEFLRACSRPDCCAVIDDGAAAVCPSCGTAAPASTPPSVALAPSTALATILIRDAVGALDATASACARAGVRAVSRTSSHPIAAQRRPIEVGALRLPAGTSAASITFDERCTTDPTDEASFFALFVLPTAMHAEDDVDSRENEVGGASAQAHAGGGSVILPGGALNAFTSAALASTSSAGGDGVVGGAGSRTGRARTGAAASLPPDAAQSGGDSAEPPLPSTRRVDAHGGVGGAGVSGAPLSTADLITAWDSAGTDFSAWVDSGAVRDADARDGSGGALVRATVLATAAHLGLECVAMYSGPSAAFKPVVARGRSFFWLIARGRAVHGRGVAGGARAAVADGGWGVAFTVAPLSAVYWRHDADIFSGAPSLLWALFLLRWLVTRGLPGRVLCTGLLHNSRVFRVLFDYLRTSGAPCKDRVLAIVHALLAAPEYALITPSHVDWPRGSARDAVAALVAAGAFPQNDRGSPPGAERAVLEALSALPLDALAALRELALRKKNDAGAIGALFLPQSLQHLLEVAVLGDAAIARVRLQAALLIATQGALYSPATAPSAQWRRALLVPGYGAPGALSPDATLIAALSARADEAVIAGVNTAAGGSPPLLMVLPSFMEQMTDLETLARLREVLLAIITGRRIPDAWALRATLLAVRTSADDLTRIGEAELSNTHAAFSAFTPAEDTALIALLSSYAMRKSLGGILEVHPSALEITESDAASFVALERFRCGAASPAIAPIGVARSEDTPAFALRVRAALLIIINNLLRKCLALVDWEGWTEGAVGAAASASGSRGIVATAIVAIAEEPLATEASAPAAAAAALDALRYLSVGAMLRRVPHLILVDSKEALVTRALDSSLQAGSSGVKVLLDNRTAMASIEHGIVSISTSMCTVTQLIRHMLEAKVADRQLRCRLSERETLFEVGYVGLAGTTEEGLDWGGLYRDTIARCMEDLFGDRTGVDLFVLSPNAAVARGGGEAGGGATHDHNFLSESTEGSFLPNPRYSPLNVERAVSVTDGAALGVGSAGDTIPANTLALAEAMYSWVGRLMGISIRTRSSDLELDIAPPIWKLIVGAPLEMKDVGALDAQLGAFLVRLRDWTYVSTVTDEGSGGFVPPPSPPEGAHAAELARAVDKAFAEEFGPLVFVLPQTSLALTAARCSGRAGVGGGGARRSDAAPTIIPQIFTFPLIPGGELVSVTIANRSAYLRAVVSAVMAPYAFAAACMRTGIAAVVPHRALSLCSWKDLRRLVSGEPDIDIENLKRNSKYECVLRAHGVLDALPTLTPPPPPLLYFHPHSNNRFFSDDHPTIKFFWRALRELTPEQKKNFVRFAWGRSRLPRGKWPLQNNGKPVMFTIVPRRGFTSGSEVCVYYTLRG